MGPCRSSIEARWRNKELNCIRKDFKGTWKDGLQQDMATMSHENEEFDSALQEGEYLASNQYTQLIPES